MPNEWNELPHRFPGLRVLREQRVRSSAAAPINDDQGGATDRFEASMIFLNLWFLFTAFSNCAA